MLALFLRSLAAFALISASAPDPAAVLAQAERLLSSPDPVDDEFLQQLQSLRASVDQLYKQLSSRAPLIHTPCAFQWAQNSTHLLLHVKFTRRWNAPGALDVKNLVLSNSSSDRLQLSAQGEHSGNRYAYFLDLSLFAEISPENIRHNFASVGRLMIHLPKKYPLSRWPRLLLEKQNTKIDNMSFWIDMHEKFAHALEAQAVLVQHSTLTCVAAPSGAAGSAAGGMYCPASDGCVSDCAACPELPLATNSGPGGLCVGPPRGVPATALVFADVDPQRGFIRGDLRFNATSVPATTGQAGAGAGLRVYLGTAAGKAASAEGGQVAPVAEVPVGSSAVGWPAVSVAISAFVAGAENDVAGAPTHLVVTAFNEHGESAKFATLAFKDFVAPPGPRSLEVAAGRAVVKLPEEAVKSYAVTGVALVFGKKDGCVRSRSIAANVTLPEPGKWNSENGEVEISFEFPPGTRAPPSATHVLAFARTALGDSVDCAAHALSAVVRGAPKTRPASAVFDGVRVLADSPAINPADGFEDFVVYQELNAGNTRGLRLGAFGANESLAVAEDVARVCVFARNYLGEGEEALCIDRPSSGTPQERENTEL